jgi:cytoskeleton protein RodZ
LSEVQAPVAESSAPTDTRTDAALSLGARLRSARKARALSLEEVGQLLHLEESMLRAIEEDRFEALGAPVFVRGYLKAYAGLLGLSGQSVLDAYRQADPASVLPPKVVRDRDELPPVGPRLPVALTIAGFGVLVLVLLFFVFRSGGESRAPTLQTGLQDELAVTSTEILAAVLPETLPADLPVAAGIPPAEAGQLVLEFVEASWVDISDSTGRLLSGEQAAGSRHVLGGQPPFVVALGNAPGVRLSVDGQPWPVPEDARTPGSNVARFRIESLSR